MKKQNITNKDNDIYEIEYKYTVTGGEPCETGVWGKITVAANNSKEAKQKLYNSLLTEFKNLECFTELTLKTNNIERIGKIGII